MRIFVALFVFCLVATSNAQTLRIEDLDPKTLKVESFSIDSDQSVSVSGTGGVFREDYQLLVYYGWILNSDTREVAWHLFDEVKDGEFKKTDGLFDFALDIPLKAGNYEMYFTGAYGSGSWNINLSISSLNDLVYEIFDSRDRQKFRRSLQEELFIEINAETLKRRDLDEMLDDKLSKAKLYYVKAMDNERYEEGFNLKATTDLNIYAIGEGGKGELYDYLYITDMHTMEPAFEMDYRNTSFAGGAEKNLRLDERITLPAGSYKITYKTDDSHSFEEWNALPPDDPIFWGVTVTPVSKTDRDNFTAYNPPKTIRPLVELTKVENNELVSVGFSLSKDMDMRVLCIGEGDDDEEEMADYGWIVDAKTRKTVWRMKGYRTDPAGGAKKNRKFEGVIDMEAGDYILYYATDGSHAYDAWNASPPGDEDKWGISLYATKESDMGKIKIFNPEAFVAKNVLAEIVMVRDNEYLRKNFSLQKDTELTVMAIGEGSSDEMHDYGWIKDMETGRVVWKMRYYDTENAGGARKNRIAVENIKLPAGDYRIYYETDGSHAFNDWNASAPSDPQSYGIRVLLAE